MLLFKQKLTSIYEALDIRLHRKEFICLVGAGGKTSTMFKLAEELKRLDKRVLVTTTTAIYYPYEKCIDRVLIYEGISQMLSLPKQKGSVTVIGKEISKDKKLQGLDKLVLDEIYNRNIFDYILVEGDGSRKKPIKAPAGYEPVIPESTSITVGIVGLDSLYKPIDDKYLHRADIFCRITNSRRNQAIDEEKIARLVVSDEGLFKNTPKTSKKYLLLNKAESQKEKESANKIIKLIADKNFHIDGIVVSSILNNEIYKGSLGIYS